MRIKEVTDMRKLMVKEITETILLDCQPFLNEIDGQIEKYSLYRGMYRYNKDFGKKESRHHNREPMNTPEGIHNEMNNWLKLRYGHPFRNGIFTTGNTDDAKSYGPAYSIFPIGNFEYLWNPKIDDMFNILVSISFGDVIQQLNTLEPYFKQDDLKKGIATKKSEIMIWCDEYYYMSDDIKSQVGKFLI